MAEEPNAMTALRKAKKELRMQMRQLLSTVSNGSIIGQCDKLAAEVRDHLLSLPQYQKASRISIYLSMPTGEITTKAIVLDALQKGKKVFIPYIYATPSPAAEEPKSVMNMVSLQSKEDYESLHPNAWGIPTPNRASIRERDSCLIDNGVRSGGLAGASTRNESLDMVVMPGMAFDKGLARLGHGKGYYDFFLQRLHQQVNVAHGTAKNQMPFLVGLALKEQLLMNEQKIPTDDLDWPLDALIVGEGSVIRNFLRYPQQAIFETIDEWAPLFKGTVKVTAMPG